MIKENMQMNIEIEHKSTKYREMTRKMTFKVEG
jgi:hypothetical protein